MFTRALKSAAVAAAVLVATAGTSFAAQYAWVDHNVSVYSKHKTNSAIVNTAWAGSKVKILDQWNNWYKIKVNGPDGWVKGSALDFAPGPFPGPFPGYGYGYGGGYGGSFCVNGTNASFCLSGGY